MRPWTTRTLNAAVVAAGFAAVGTGSASAADAANPGLPDLSQVPDDIGITVPLHTCQAPGLAQGQAVGHCADVTLKASNPNTFKKVGADIATVSHGVAGELRNGRSPLSAVEPNRVLGHVAGAQTQVKQLTDTRPTIGAKAETGRLGEGGKHTKLLDAEIGPREPGHEGVSTADTAIDLTAAQGQTLAPLRNPAGSATGTARQNDSLPVSDHRVDLPKAGELVSAPKHTPAMAALDDGLAGVAGRTGDDLTTAAPVGKATDALSPVGDLTGSLPAPGLG